MSLTTPGCSTRDETDANLDALALTKEGVSARAMPRWDTCSMTRPGFLHTSPAHVATFDALLSEALPGVRALHVVDESLLSGARADGLEAVAGRVAERLAKLRAQGAGIVCCTCSTIGDVAEQTNSGIPLLRVDRPMAVHSVGIGRRIGVVAALASTLEPTRALLATEAISRARDIEITLVTADGAWSRFESGEHDDYLARIADAARELASSVDVIVLAQASMAKAGPLLTDLTVPVLSSPRLAVEYLAHWMRVEQYSKKTSVGDSDVLGEISSESCREVEPKLD